MFQLHLPSSARNLEASVRRLVTRLIATHQIARDQ